MKTGFGGDMWVSTNGVKQHTQINYGPFYRGSQHGSTPPQVLETATCAEQEHYAEEQPKEP